MPINTPTFDYPFDPHGQLPGNIITNEQHVFVGSVNVTYQKIVPRWAPFFANDLEVRFISPQNQTSTLVLGEDYYLGNKFIQATRACAQPIYGSINILNKSLQGTIVVTYRTLGGMWTLDEQAIAQILADQLYNPRLISWEAIVDLPIMFPVIDHEWDIADMKGMGDVVGALQNIRDALAITGESGLEDHINNKNNPHNVTKTQVGLGSVQNLPLASSAEARAGTSNSRYMTPIRTKEAISHQVGDELEDHLNDTDNPHDVTPSKIGAVSVDDFLTALAGKLGVNEAAADSELFNGRTLAQVMTHILAGTAANSLRLGNMSLQELQQFLLSSTVYDSERFAGMTLSEFNDNLYDILSSLPSLPGTVENSMRLEGFTLVELLDQISNVEIENALRLEGQSLEDVLTLASEGKSSDSDRIEGLDLENLVDFIAEQLVTDRSQAHFEDKTYRPTSGIPAGSSEYFHVTSARIPYNPEDAQEAITRGHNKVAVDIDVVDSSGEIAQYGRFELYAGAADMYCRTLYSSLEDEVEFYWIKADPSDTENIFEDIDGTKYLEVTIFAKLYQTSRVRSTVYGGIVKSEEPFEQFSDVADAPGTLLPTIQIDDSSRPKYALGDIEQGASATVTIDPNKSDVIILNITQAIAEVKFAPYLLANKPNSHVLSLVLDSEVEQPVINWDENIYWPSYGEAPSLDLGIGRVSILTFLFLKDKIYGFVSGENFLSNFVQ